MTQKLPMIYNDPNIRKDVFDRMSADMKRLYLEAFPYSVHAGFPCVMCMVNRQTDGGLVCDTCRLDIDRARTENV